MKKKRKIYALYKGDTNICDGTIKEIAKFLNTSETNIRCIKSRQFLNKGNRYELIYLGTEEELDTAIVQRNSIEEELLNMFEEEEK